MILIQRISTSHTYRVWSRLEGSQIAALAGVTSVTSPHDGLCLVTLDPEAEPQAVLDAIRALAGETKANGAQ